MIEMLRLAAKVALPTIENDRRAQVLGAVGLREDGTLVSAKNGAVPFQSVIEYYQSFPNAHAEARLLRKLGKNGIIFVARVAKKDGQYAMARPCDQCRARIKAANVSKVYYTISASSYGIWYPNKDQDKTYEL